LRRDSEIEPTVIGLVGFFLPAIYFRGKTDGRLVIERLRWLQMDCSSGCPTLTSGPNIGEPAFIDGDYQLATEMLKVTRADKLHSGDG
jgi:hypothetical protein